VYVCACAALCQLVMSFSFSGYCEVEVMSTELGVVSTRSYVNRTRRPMTSTRYQLTSGRLCMSLGDFSLVMYIPLPHAHLQGERDRNTGRDRQDFQLRLQTDSDLRSLPQWQQKCTGRQGRACIRPGRHQCAPQPTLRDFRKYQQPCLGAKSCQ
jgi:hypothetical protein